MYKNILPQVVEVPLEKGKMNYTTKCLIHEKLLYQYLLRKINGWNVINFLKNEKIKNYVLYALTDFTTLFYEDLRRNDSQCSFDVICDKNAKKYNYRFNDKKVIMLDELDELYKKEKVNKIIVMSVLHEKEIVDELLKTGILLNDIISFVSILYS